MKNCKLRNKVHLIQILLNLLDLNIKNKVNNIINMCYWIILVLYAAKVRPKRFETESTWLGPIISFSLFIISFLVSYISHCIPGGYSY